jgi:ferrochelatase
MKIGVLLVNLGTPLSPKPKDVFRYLNEFLTDPRVIDLPFLLRQLLVRGLIVPKRYKTSAKSYSQIWTKEGSPLLMYGYALKELLQKALGEDFLVDIAMRYQYPSLEDSLKTLKTCSLSKLIVIPLFPQYASATTGSIYAKVFSSLSEWVNFPELIMIQEFYDHPLLIKAFAALAKEHSVDTYDHIVMSFHGLPETHLKKADVHSHCLTCSKCCYPLQEKNKRCYSAQCYATAKAIAQELSLSSEKFTICFQSRLGKKPWLSPFTSDVIKTLPQKGYKKILVMCPAFICDCLETLYEIQMEYQEEFKHHGGDILTLMPGLNTHPLWIHTLKEIVLSRI